MGYSASKGVRDHRLALAQRESRSKTWHNFQKDVDDIVSSSADPEVAKQALKGRYHKFRRSQQKLDLQYRRAGGRKATPSSRTMAGGGGPGPRSPGRYDSRRVSPSAADRQAMAYTQQAFNSSRLASPPRAGHTGAAAPVHAFDSQMDIPPPPPDDDEPPPPPPDYHLSPQHVQAQQAAHGHGRLRQTQSLASPAFHHSGQGEFLGVPPRGPMPQPLQRHLRHKSAPAMSVDEDEFQRLIMPPLPPRQISATGSSVTVQWVCTEPTAMAFELQFRPKNRAEWRTISNKITERTYVLRNLPPGRGFYLRVRCMSDRGWSSYSITSRVIRPEKRAPMQPTPPVIAEVGTDSVTVTWEAPSSNGARITLYTLLMGTQVVDNGGAVLGEDITMVYSGPDNWYRARALQPKTQYTFRVIASNSYGDSDVSPHTTCVTKTPEAAKPLRTIGDWSEWWDDYEARSYFINSVYVLHTAPPHPYLFAVALPR